MPCQPSFIGGQVYSSSGTFIYDLLYLSVIQTKLDFIFQVYTFIAYLYVTSLERLLKIIYTQ